MVEARRRRPFQFGLRTLLLAITVSAAVLSGMLTVGPCLSVLIGVYLLWLLRVRVTVYWSSQVTNTMLRNEEVIVTGINNLRGIALDAAGGWIYWASLSDDKIERARLDGSGREDVVAGLGNPYGIALALPSASVPEPTSLVLWAGLGIMGLIAARRKKRVA